MNGEDHIHTPTVDEATHGGPLKELLAKAQDKQLLLLLIAQSQVLEMIAEGAPLAAIADELLRAIEKQVDGMLCSILLLSDDRQHLAHLAAPSLPQSYMRAIDGGAIGPRAGSCGTAAYLGEQVIVADIANDPLWADYAKLALAAQLRSCWSTPIFSRHGDVLGTFAIYYRQPGRPKDIHLALIAVATYLAGIAIERDFAERQRRRSEHERERLLAQERRTHHRLLTLVEELPIGVLVADRNGRVIAHNQQVAAILRRPIVPCATIEEYGASGVFHLDGSSYEAHGLPLARAVEHGERVVREELMVRRGDGTTATVCASSAPIRDQHGQLDGGMVVFWDISERKRAESEIERLVSELREAVEARDQFLSVASHELRTPLACLLLHTQLLMEQLRDEPLDATRLSERADATYKQIKRLERLVGEILEVGRLGTGKLSLNLEAFDVAALVREVAERMAGEGADRRERLQVDADVAVRGLWDRGRLEQVITHLISNGLKYGLHRPVHISVGSKGRNAHIEVRDSGIGIEPEHQRRIFERFERQASERHYGGLGLGLWVSRQIVEAHGGAIAVHSARDQGATFTVELPLDGPPA